MISLTKGAFREHHSVVEVVLVRLRLILDRNFRSINDENIYRSPLGIQF